MDAFQKAAEMYDGLVRDHPDVERYTYKLAMCLNDLGNQQAASGPGKRGVTRRTRVASRSASDVVRLHPGVPEYLKELGIGYQVWSDRQRTAGLTLDSMRSNEQARAIFERLVREHPDVADYRWRLTSRSSRI